MNDCRKVSLCEPWRDFFNNDDVNEKLESIDSKLRNIEYYPPTDMIFSAFRLCPLDKLKVIIIGQDPYDGIGEDGTPIACGMSFSSYQRKIPPSLKMVFKVLEKTVSGFISSDTPCLNWWATQGVMLYNKALTLPAFRENRTENHINLWSPFTQVFIEYICRQKSGLIFMLWGRKAQEVKKYIGSNHTVLECLHPSPLSSDTSNPNHFSHMNHFNEANEILKNIGRNPIQWVFPGFYNHKNDMLYFDIETTGFCLNAKEGEEFIEIPTKNGSRKVKKNKNNYTTCICWFINGKVKIWYKTQKPMPFDGMMSTIEELKEDWKRAKKVVSFNGIDFDEIFLIKDFGMERHLNHYDIRKEHKINKGGLKELAKRYGFSRDISLNGSEAPDLYNNYKKVGWEKPIRKLLYYLQEDVLDTYFSERCLLSLPKFDYKEKFIIKKP